MNKKTHYNTGNFPGLSRRGETQTIQDMSLTVAQHLQRLANGIPFQSNGLQYPEFEEDESFRVNDLTDLDRMYEILDEATERIERENQRMREAAAKRTKDDAAKPIEEAENTDGSSD